MSHYHGHHHYYWLFFDLAKKIFKNKAIMMVVLGILLLFFIMGVWLISLTLPLLGQLFAIIQKEGIKGILETIMPYLLKLWEGAGK